MERVKSLHYVNRACKVIPGGVNSPVRAFGAVGGTPPVIEKAQGQYLYDVDGNRYVDYIGSWGAMILGHNHECIKEAVSKQMERGVSFGATSTREVEMAELMCDLIPSLEMVRMVNSGTEAVMSAIRVARGFTGKNKIVKFEGCYHGHSDSLLVKAGSGFMTAGIPDSSGVTDGSVKDTLSAVYNNIESVEILFEENRGEIACVIVEPVAANMGLVVPKEGFLQALREICDKENALLIFDEVITGFRLGIDGASGYFGVSPDLFCFGKIIGGGMPVGAYGGRKDVMKVVAPLGDVYQAGTLSGNPVAMSAGIAQLQFLKEHPDIYTKINELGELFRSGVRELFVKMRLPYRVEGIGALSCIYFTEKKVVDYTSAKTSDTGLFAKYFHTMLRAGNYFAPSQFEAIFISSAHTKENIYATLQDVEEFCQQLTKE